MNSCVFIFFYLLISGKNFGTWGLKPTTPKDGSGPAYTNQTRKVIKFATESDVAVALAQYTADLSEKYIKEKGSFTVVLSGGTLIETLRNLTVSPYKNTVEWSKWLVFWVDERVVPLNDNLSNYKLANDGFFKKVKKIPQKNIFPIKYSTSPDDVAKDYEARVKTLVEKKTLPLKPWPNIVPTNFFPVFDLMLNGIGPDGHLASLFPNKTQRFENKSWVTSISDSPKPPPQRITFTFPVIKVATNIAMVVTGGDLAEAVHKALDGSCDMPPITCAELQAEAEGEMTWFLDKDAASKLIS